MVGDNQSDWLRLEELFHEAADLSPAEQAAFLDDRCGNDAVLRAELFALLAESSLGTTKFRSAVAATARGLAEDRDREWIGRRVGPWRVERPISQGGMGQVYEVERADGAYTQRAALKALRWEIDTPEARRAFAEERQILARLEHPNVARLVDGGETIGGQPYLVLEFVEGTPITEYVQAKKLSIEERLRLMITVCKAVHAAHKSLIIHQDLKPENIL
ncbi:MAG TPA: protein kinase, partial [Bryobacteraceae bacterium]|nr:protein kinase [Bryobacteraceae bacterium]